MKVCKYVYHYVCITVRTYVSVFLCVYACVKKHQKEKQYLTEHI